MLQEKQRYLVVNTTQDQAGEGKRGESKGGKGAKLWKGKRKHSSEQRADKKAGRLEGLWHFGKTKRREARAFKLWIRAKERKRIE